MRCPFDDSVFIVSLLGASRTEIKDLNTVVEDLKKELDQSAQAARDREVEARIAVRERRECLAGLPRAVCVCWLCRRATK